MLWRVLFMATLEIIAAEQLPAKCVSNQFITSNAKTAGDLNDLKGLSASHDVTIVGALGFPYCPDDRTADQILQFSSQLFATNNDAIGIVFTHRIDSPNPYDKGNEHVFVRLSTPGCGYGTTRTTISTFLREDITKDQLRAGVKALTKLGQLYRISVQWKEGIDTKNCVKLREFIRDAIKDWKDTPGVDPRKSVIPRVFPEEFQQSSNLGSSG